MRLLSILLLTLFLMACVEKKSTENLRAIVQKQNSLLETYFKEANADKLSQMYTDSAKLSPNGGKFVVGRNNIKAFWAEDFKTSKLIEMNTSVLTTNGNSDLIYETGKTTSKILYKDSIYNVSVKYINVWVKQLDGTYKLDIDFWNADEK